MGNPVHHSSFVLGKFVYQVQAMEEAIPHQRKKGADWGEQVLTLFSANLESTLQMIEKIIGDLPESLTLPSGDLVSKGDLHGLLTEIDFLQLESLGIEKDVFLEGYHHPFSTEEPVEEEKIFVPEEEQSQSYYLGVFMGTLFCLEKAVAPQSLEPERDYGEDNFLLVEINLHTAMQLAQKTIATLPQVAEFRGKPITLKQLEEASAMLQQERLFGESLLKKEFLRGFQEVFDCYHRE